MNTFFTCLQIINYLHFPVSFFILLRSLKVIFIFPNDLFIAFADGLAVSSDQSGRPDVHVNVSRQGLLLRSKIRAKGLSVTKVNLFNMIAPTGFKCILADLLVFHKNKEVDLNQVVE